MWVRAMFALLLVLLQRQKLVLPIEFPLAEMFQLWFLQIWRCESLYVKLYLRYQLYNHYKYNK